MKFIHKIIKSVVLNMYGHLSRVKGSMEDYSKCKNKGSSERKNNWQCLLLQSIEQNRIPRTLHYKQTERKVSSKMPWRVKLKNNAEQINPVNRYFLNKTTITCNCINKKKYHVIFANKREFSKTSSVGKWLKQIC